MRMNIKVVIFLVQIHNVLSSYIDWKEIQLRVFYPTRWIKMVSAKEGTTKNLADIFVSFKSHIRSSGKLSCVPSAVRLQQTCFHRCLD